MNIHRNSRTYRTRQSVVSLGATVLVAAGALFSSAMASEPGPTLHGIEDALAQDAQIYALDFGVSQQNAVARLRQQEDVASIEAGIRDEFGPTVTYVRIVHQPDFSVIVGVFGDVEPVAASIRDRLPEFGLQPDLFAVVRTDYSAAELEDVAEAMRVHLDGLSGTTTLNIRYDAGIVELQAENDAFAAELLESALPAQIPAHRYVVTGGVPLGGPEADVYAGLNGNGCTRAFSVKNASGTRGVLTAGHCSDNQDSPGVNLDFVLGYSSGNTDAQWNKAAAGASVTFRNWAKDNSTDPTTPGYRLITSAASTYTLGTVVCAYKTTTLYDCGVIESVAYDPDGILPTWSASFVEVEPNVDGTDISGAGDSGAGWFSANRAYGIHFGSAIFEPNNALFGKISSATSNLGVSVLTS